MACEVFAPMTTDLALRASPAARSSRRPLESAVVRFAGDSGDGIQLTGLRFTAATALAGNDLATFPDFPAEIRAPAGTTYGVSAFQINFGARAIKTSGDRPDVLVALNPAALKVELPVLKAGGVVIVDSGAFAERDLKRAGYERSPLADGTLDGYQVLAIDISRLTLEAVKPHGVSQHEGLRCRNFWALGLVYWMFDRDREPTRAWIARRFADEPRLVAANTAALDAGHIFGESSEIAPAYRVEPAPLAPGQYRVATGGEALAFGLLVGAHLAGRPLFFASYPITPASPILHLMSAWRALGVTTLQAEDEIAAACAAIGAAYAGAIGVTSSSGPGIALKSEAIGLAVASELPLVIVDTQRAGPSTGMPTKTEQSDLNLALFGRHGEAPVVVLAARSPADAFDAAVEAVRLATRFMTPVYLLSDGYIANAAQPWKIPDLSSLPPFPARLCQPADGARPFARDGETLARPWVVPGTPGLEYRLGGLEKDELSGAISYDPANHQRMTELRAAKIAGVAAAIGEQGIDAGPPTGRLAVVGWGSTWGPISRAVSLLHQRGVGDVAHIHLRHLCPLPRNLGSLLAGYAKVLVIEMNSGQLQRLLRAELLLQAVGYHKVAGQPLTIEEVEAVLLQHLGGGR